MSLDIHYLAHQVEHHHRSQQVVRDQTPQSVKERHPMVLRFGAVLGRLGHRLQGQPALPDCRPCPNPGPALG